MRFSTVVFSILSLSTLSLAAPHGDHGAPTSTNSTSSTSSTIANSPSTTPSAPPVDPSDEEPGSGGDWNVITDDDDPRTLDEMISEMGLTVADLKYVYNNTAFKGFSASLSKHCVNRMINMTGWRTYNLDTKVQLHDKTPGTWGLKRISQSSRVLSVKGQADTTATFESYTFKGEEDSLGAGVDIYIADTGVNIDHVEFGGRATFGWAFDNDKTDDNGHGTHCAGIAASRTFGVAKGANIIGVKVLGGEAGEGSSSDVMAGIDFIASEHERKSKLPGFKGSVLSMSLGGPRLPPFDDNGNPIVDPLLDSLRAVSQLGVHISVAAGNENANACDTSPAFASSGSAIITVGASTIDDARASFSNFGSCVTVYAPGTEVNSTFVGSDTATEILQGTSMACPHVTGLIAYNLGLYPSLRVNPAAMKGRIVGDAGRIWTGKAGDPSILINNGFRGR